MSVVLYEHFFGIQNCRTSNKNLQIKMHHIFKEVIPNFHALKYFIIYCLLARENDKAAFS